MTLGEMAEKCLHERGALHAEVMAEDTALGQALRTLGFWDAEVYDGEVCDFALWVDGETDAKYPALDMKRIRVTVAPLKE